MDIITRITIGPTINVCQIVPYEDKFYSICPLLSYRSIIYDLAAFKKKLATLLHGQHGTYFTPPAFANRQQSKEHHDVLVNQIRLKGQSHVQWRTRERSVAAEPDKGSSPYRGSIIYSSSSNSVTFGYLPL